MKIYEIDGKKYRLPNELTDFQLQMYIHMINWKWAHLTQESGFFKNSPYDALLLDELKLQGYPLYRPIKELLLEHQQRFPFKSHKFLGHMASSQAACANLFLPILEDPLIAAKVLGAVITDLKSIATDELEKDLKDLLRENACQLSYFMGQ